MFKDFFIKKMAEKHLKNMSEEQKSQIAEMVAKNPQLFEKIAQEAKAGMESGQDMMDVVKSIIDKNREELKKSFPDIK